METHKTSGRNRDVNEENETKTPSCTRAEPCLYSAIGLAGQDARRKNIYYNLSRWLP